MCKPCAERRRAIMDAWQQRKITEAVRQVGLGVRDIVKGNGDGGKET